MTAPAVTAIGAKALPASARPGHKIDEKTLIKRFNRLRQLVTLQSLAIAGLTGLLLVILPFAQPLHRYFAMMPDDTVTPMAGLDMPNMTNRAVLSWATTSITEILTMGFGDIDIRLPQQKKRFTPEGWDVFTEVFNKMKIRQQFKRSQLVLTTVPSNTPVIVAQGVNNDDLYQWVVQMPVIMTYATNNNVTRKEPAMITLTIVRVPADESSAGIAILKWEQYH